VILGGASCVWDDYAALKPRIGKHHLIAVNLAGVTAPDPLLAWVSLHPECLGDWQRQRKGHPARYVVTHRRHHDQGPVRTVVLEKWGGSSGLYAVQVARDLFNFQKIVLCGVPIDPHQGHINGASDWLHGHHFQKKWTRAIPEIAPFVRSMSGHTKDVLGFPDTAFLEEFSHA
jgi:hypothetical protein